MGCSSNECMVIKAQVEKYKRSTIYFRKKSALLELELLKQGIVYKGSATAKEENLDDICSDSTEEA